LSRSGRGPLPLPCVALSCVLIIEYVYHFGLDENVASTVKDAISKSFASVTSDSHALAVLLDPAVPVAHLAAVRELLHCAGNRSLEATARSTLNMAVDWLGMSPGQKSRAHAQLNGIIMSLYQCLTENGRKQSFIARSCGGGSNAWQFLRRCQRLA
jgi:hypothetical protein